MNAPILLLSLAALAPFAVPQDAPSPVETATLGATRNVHRSGDLWFAGQFAPDDLKSMRERSIARVITARTDGELDWDEAAKVEAAGMAFVAVPFKGPDTLTESVFEEVRMLLAEDSGPTLFHCGSANRVAAAWLPYRVLDQGVPLEQALVEAETIGLRTPAYKDLAIAYIERMSGRGEKSVKEGINDAFKDPELDVDAFVQRFEVESREVYAARHAIVGALGIRPGMRVADIGAGTGLYSFLFADAVGPTGWIYAVDIAPRFLKHILQVSSEHGTNRISTVLCPEKSVGLPPESVDLAYVCDTYHHFEYPRSTLASIHSALRPGGRLVVIDFERVPGESSDWVMNHVRADKGTFRGEIEAAGFRFVREADVEGLAENYFLEFEKPQEN